MHGTVITALSRSAFVQALGMVRRGGTISLIGVPPGDFPLPIFSTTLNGITVRGSIVGPRRDLQEAVCFAAEGKVCAHLYRKRLENINELFADLIDGKVTGRSKHPRAMPPSPSFANSPMNLRRKTPS